MNSKTIFWIIRIACLVTALWFVYCYFAEASIIATDKTFPYTITKIHCNYGGKSSSYVTIIKGGKEYEIELPDQLCQSKTTGDIINLYYDNLRDYYFIKERTGLTKALCCFVFFGFTFWIEHSHRKKTQ